ncbi:hypothetical protein Dimus_024227 [Dionaea muscipula]
MTVIHSKKKDIVKSKVRGIEIEFDHEKLATILGVPRANGICEYIKEVWEESKYTKPLEITRRFANDESIMAARRGHLKLLGSYIHGPFDVQEKDKPPRVMIRHMSYVISMKDHELPYGDRLTMVFQAFGVPLVDKKGEEPKRYDFFEETFLTMCKSTRENGIWWIGSGENRRRDDDEADSGGRGFVSEMKLLQRCSSTIMSESESPVDSSAQANNRLDGFGPSQHSQANDSPNPLTSSSPLNSQIVGGEVATDEVPDGDETGKSLECSLGSLQ